MKQVRAVDSNCDGLLALVPSQACPNPKQAISGLSRTTPQSRIGFKKCYMIQNIEQTIEPEECMSKIFEISGAKFEPEMAFDL